MTADPLGQMLRQWRATQQRGITAYINRLRKPGQVMSRDQQDRNALLRDAARAGITRSHTLNRKD